MKPAEELIPDHSWSLLKKFGFRMMVCYVLLFILTLSFPHPHIPDVPGMIAPVFEKLVKWTGDHVLRISEPYTHQLVSDSTGLYIHLLILVVLSLVAATAWTLLDKRSRNYCRLQYGFVVIISYYLAFHLMVYGFNKVFKWQFYLPEPNTLFTTMGHTYRDLLYWSTMGTSHSYNVFLGSMELIAAVLLLFRKTRLPGALASIVIMVNVVMINFSFDISVKIYSCFLLVLSVLILLPDGRRLFQFFTGNTRIPDISWRPRWERPLHRNSYRVIKSIVIAWMLWSLLTAYFRTRNFNDDLARRPVFHGAYDIPVFIKNGDTIAPLLTDSYRWKRLFIHRRGYLIIQSMNDGMQDFAFVPDTIDHRWSFTHELTGARFEMNYRMLTDSTILLDGKIRNDSLSLELKKIDLSKLPLLQNEFSWTIDDQ